MNDTRKAALWVLYTATKYFTSHRRKKIHFASLSVFGIAAGFIAIIVVIGIMNGLQEGYLNDLVEIDSYHLRVTVTDGDALDAVLDSMAALDDIAVRFPFLEMQAIVRNSVGTAAPVLIKGVPPAYFSADRGAAAELTLFSGTLQVDDEGIILGRSLAETLQAGTGTELVIMAIGEGRTVNFVPLETSVTLSGIVRSGYPEIDSHVAFVSLDLLRQFLPKSVPLIGVKADDGLQSYRTIRRELEALPQVEQVSSWQERNRSLYSALQLEKYSMMVVLFLIFIVVAFSIRNSLQRFVFLQRRDVGLFFALGVSKRRIALVFLLQGIFVAVAGSLIGILSGVIIAGNVNRILHGLALALQSLFSYQALFLMYSFPVRLVPAEIGVITIAVLSLCLLISWSAVRRLLYFEPVRILHYE